MTPKQMKAARKIVRDHYGLRRGIAEVEILSELRMMQRYERDNPSALCMDVNLAPLHSALCVALGVDSITDLLF